MLNIGGVLGICDSVNPDKGKPFDCRVLGVALHFPYLGERIGVPARVGYQARSTPTPTLDTRGVPVVALAGTCMEAGKTAAACAIIARMRHRGLIVDAFKATGVSLRRDILAMEDAGARRCAIFTDLGIVTTTRSQRPGAHAHHADRAGRRQARRHRVRAGRRHPRHLRRGRHPRVRRTSAPRSRGVVLSANDPVAAWGGVKLLRERFGIEPCVVTGPSTDNQVGVEIITGQMGVPAFNAMSNGAALGDRVIEALGLKTAAPAAA